MLKVAVVTIQGRERDTLVEQKDADRLAQAAAAVLKAPKSSRSMDDEVIDFIGYTKELMSELVQ